MANELLKTLAGATGLPEDLVFEELSRVLSSKGIEENEATLDEIREALAGYLREVILHAKDKFDSGVWIEDEISPDELGTEN